MPPDLRRRFVESGVAHPAIHDENKTQITQKEFERFFDASDQICYSWQEEYNDDDDDANSDLLRLLQLLRELADLETFFV